VLDDHLHVSGRTTFGCTAHKRRMCRRLGSVDVYTDRYL
jgi:hypothetical protein